MYPQFLIIPALMITIYCHTPKNNSDVIVQYSGHAEAIEEPIVSTTTIATETTTVKETEQTVDFIVLTEAPNRHYTTRKSTPFYDEDTESVVFIPHDKPIRRFNDYSDHEDRISVKDILTKGKNINDVLSSGKIVVQTEEPKQDILFISGKNGENDNVEELKKQKEEKHLKSGRRSNSVQENRKVLVNCKHLDCNNTVNSVCSGKLERRQWRYRLFLNECFFNKVNCNFKYEENKFQLMPIEKCKNVAEHYITEKPFIYVPMYNNLPEPKPVKVEEYRRSFSSRRSLNIDVNGKFCSHPCPASCPEQYEPECAMSNKGLRRVFVNHCKLDYNSCSYGAVWQKRPLAECVGGPKADMARNSAFIGWMQRVGIVDNKGRLKLE